MYFHRLRFKIWPVALLFLAVIFTAPNLSGQTAELVLNIDDIGIEPGIQEITIPVFLTNQTDTITRFEMLVIHDRPDVTGFHWLIDTTGTLIGGWESVSSENFDGMNTNILINAEANLADPPEVTPGIAPQAGETPLLKLIAFVEELDDTLPDQTVRYLTNKIYPFCPLFFNQGGEPIGIVPDTVCDSVYFRCLYWVEDLCLEWQKVQSPPYDSADFECNNILILDTTVVNLYNGSVTVMLSTCGDVNGNGEIDISDISALISYLYLEGDPPPVMRVANLDGSADGTIDISDITYVIAALYIDHRELVCPYIPPEE